MMERVGDVRKLQSGGTGIGFTVPRPILRTEPRIFFEASRQMLANNGNHLDGEPALFQVCKKDLQERLFFISQRQKESRRALDASKPAASSASATDGASGSNVHTNGSLNSTNLGTKRCYPFPVSSSDQVLESVDEVFENVEEVQKKPKTACLQVGASNATDGDSISVKTKKCIQTFERVVPRMPRTIEDLVELWREGSVAEGLLPLRFYQIAEGRNKHIKNYNHKFWEGSGQNRAFFRFKQLIELVLRDAEPSPSIHEKGEGAEWENAIEGFHFMWSQNGDKVLSLSKVLKMWEKLRQTSLP